MKIVKLWFGYTKSKANKNAVPFRNKKKAEKFHIELKSKGYKSEIWMINDCYFVVGKDE